MALRAEESKTEGHIGKKIIPLSEDEQALIAPYLEGKKPSEAVFSPRTAVKERAELARAERKSKVTPSQQKRNQHRADNPPNRQIGEFYDRDSYRRAIKYAIEKGNRRGQQIKHWSPYLLRNAGETAIELEYGLDEAQAQLGHTSANMTKRYSDAQLKIREELALKRVNPFEEPANHSKISTAYLQIRFVAQHLCFYAVPLIKPMQNKICGTPGRRALRKTGTITSVNQICGQIFLNLRSGMEA